MAQQTIVIEVPGTPISELETTSNVTAKDVLPIVQDGETKKVPLEQVSDLVKAELGSAAFKKESDFATPTALNNVAKASQVRDDAQNERIDSVEHGLVSIGSGADASFGTYAEMIAYVPPKANVSVRNNDPDPNLRGVYIWDGSKYTEGYDPLIAANEFSLKKYDESVEYVNSRFGFDNSNLYKQENNVVGKFVSVGNNNIATDGSTALNKMRIQAGKTYAIKSTTFNLNAFIVVLRESDSTEDGATLGRVTFKDTEDPNVKTFTIPSSSTATYAFFSVLLPAFNFDIRESCIVNEGTIIKQQIVASIAGDPVADLEARKILLPKKALITTEELYDSQKNIAGNYVNAASGNIDSAPDVVMGQFPVVAGNTYTIRSDLPPGIFFVALRETDSTNVGKTLSKVSVSATTDPNVVTLTIPRNSTANFVLFNIKLPAITYDISSGLSIKAGEKIFGYNAVIGINNLPIADLEAREKLAFIDFLSSKLKNKTLLVIGDSITEHNYRTHKNYHDFIAEIVGGMTVLNYGQSGSGYKDRFNVADTITQPSDAIDIITVFFGTNDWGFANKPLGSFLDSTEDTISGCINICISKLLNKFPTKPIAVFTPLPRADNWGSNAAKNAVGYTLEELVNLIIQYAKHYSIPYLDLYHESSLPVWIPSANEYYFKAPSFTEPDGLHPNDAGHLVMAKKILAFLESITF